MCEGMFAEKRYTIVDSFLVGLPGLIIFITIIFLLFILVLIMYWLQRHERRLLYQNEGRGMTLSEDRSSEESRPSTPPPLYSDAFKHVSLMRSSVMQLSNPRADLLNVSDHQRNQTVTGFGLLESPCPYSYLERPEPIHSHSGARSTNLAITIQPDQH
jgi:cbb3-type cytochrome oxidase subunit 3